MAPSIASSIENFKVRQKDGGRKKSALVFLGGDHDYSLSTIAKVKIFLNIQNKCYKYLLGMSAGQ